MTVIPTSFGRNMQRVTGLPGVDIPCRYEKCPAKQDGRPPSWSLGIAWAYAGIALLPKAKWRSRWVIACNHCGRFSDLPDTLVRDWELPSPKEAFTSRKLLRFSQGIAAKRREAT